MPIYDALYRRYQARAPLHAWRFWPVTREALRQVLLRRMLILLLGFSWLPLLYPVGRVFVVARMSQMVPLLNVDARLFGDFLGGQTYLALLMLLFGGAGLIANDLNSGGMLLYLSRAISRRDYVIGKLAAAAALALSVTLVPAALVYVVAIALLPERFLHWGLIWLAPAIAVQSLLMALILSLSALACSSLTRRPAISGIAFFAVLMGLDLAQALLVSSLGLDAAPLLSPLASLRVVGHALFGSAPVGAVHWTWALLSLALFALAALAIVRRRVRAVEIVA
jgi:ABC-type transport system involved in multi-copper enzyme maturation permease subunit